MTEIQLGDQQMNILKDIEEPRHQEVAFRMTFESGIKIGDARMTMKQSPGQG